MWKPKEIIINKKVEDDPVTKRILKLVRDSGKVRGQRQGKKRH